MKNHFYNSCHGKLVLAPEMKWNYVTCLHCLKKYAKVLRNLPKTAKRARLRQEEIEYDTVKKQIEVMNWRHRIKIFS